MEDKSFLVYAFEVMGVIFVERMGVSVRGICRQHSQASVMCGFFPPVR